MRGGGGAGKGALFPATWLAACCEFVWKFIELGGKLPDGHVIINQLLLLSLVTTDFDVNVSAPPPHSPQAGYGLN